MGAVDGQFLSLTHSTHARSLQNGLPVTPLQSLASAHWPQRPSAQMGVAPLHCALVVQPRHSPVTVLQKGVAAGQAASDVQPALQRLSPLQIGVALGQSELVRQPTHWPSATRQNGETAGQSLFCAQATQRRVTASQIGRPVPAQSAEVTQPTHAPVVVSHFG